jgi:hypothetical protein
VSPTRSGSLSWWIRDRHGDVALVQRPNPALVVWLTCTVLRWSDLLGDRRDLVVCRAGQGALVVWGLDELVRGASPARRVLGAVVLVVTTARLLG